MKSTRRVSSVDFWRGCVLVVILLDHVPGNLLEWLTPRNYGISDSSEAFVFLSGLSVGMVYGPRAEAIGLASVALGCARRALKLYGAHIVLTLLALLVFAGAYWLSGAESIIAPHGRSILFASPASGLAGVTLLSHQLGYFNILPLYIVLMLWAPFVLAVALRNRGAAVLVSTGIYLTARVFGLHLPNWPEPGAWFFNPFAWQLIFTLGVVSALFWRNGPPRRPALVLLSGVAVIASALAVTDAFRLAPGLRETLFTHLDVGKQDLGLARLAHFAALAYLLSVAPSMTKVVESPLGRAMQGLGRHSLPVFAAGSLGSALGQAGLAILPSAFLRVEHLAGLAYTLTCVAGLFALVRWIECRTQISPSAAFAASARQPL